MSINHSRFKDSTWYKAKYPDVTIGGAGGIGSWLAFFLARIGVPMRIYDYDTVDFTNLGGQLYPKTAIGRNKVEAVADVVRDFSDYVKIRNCGKFIHGDSLTPITFACFDNMRARKDMFETWYEKYVTNTRLSVPSMFIDGRMTIESYQVIGVTPENADKYRDYLFHDSEVREPICSLKATSHIGAQIGSHLTQMFTNFITNYDMGTEFRDLPLFKAYEAQFVDFI